MNGITQDAKPWYKPELIVLARSKPEEMVLQVCKNTWRGSAGGGSNQVRSGYCFGWPSEGQSGCPGQCNTYRSS